MVKARAAAYECRREHAGGTNMPTNLDTALARARGSHGHGDAVMALAVVRDLLRLSAVPT